MAKESRVVHLEIEGKNKLYRVESDRHTYCITYYAVRTSRDGVESDAWYMLPASYYGSLEGVLGRLLREEIRDAETTSIEELIAAIQEATASIVAAVKDLSGLPQKGVEE